MQLRQYVFIVWRWLWLVVLGTALASGAAYYFNRRITPVYSATATIRVNLKSADSSSVDYNSVLLSEELLQTYSELLRMPDVLDPAGARLSVPMTGEELAGRVQVKSVRNTQLLDVTVEDTDPALAAESANAVAEVLKERNEKEQLDRFVTLKDSLSGQMAEAEQAVAATQVELDALRGPLSPAEEARRAQLQTTLAQYRSNLVSLTDNLTQVRLAEAQATNGVIIVQSALAPTRPIRPRTLTNTLLAGVVGVLLALGIAFVVEYLDDTIKTPEDIEQTAQAPTLGVIARIEGRKPSQHLVTALTPRSPVSEAYRSLRTNIQFSGVDKDVRSVLVTSSSPVEGKTTTAANLAVALAQAGKRVIAVDSDLRRPALHKFFRVSNGDGLTLALLDGQAPVEAHLQATEIENLKVLSSGPLPPNPAELLGSQRMAQLLQELGRLADVLVLDSPPLLAVTDAALLARNVDATLVVVNAGRTRRAFLGRAVEMLRAANANCLGMVLNRIMPSRSGYYAYAYQDYYSHSDDGGRRRRSRRGLFARLFGRNGHSPDAEAAQPEPPLAFSSVVNPPSQPAPPDVLESFVSVGAPAVNEEAGARPDERSSPRRKKKTGPAALEEAIRDSWRYLSA